jgi:hypothetical protein
MNPRRLAAWLVGASSGLGIWAVSLPVFGVQEPWDGSFPRYCLLVALSGAICEIVSRPRRKIDLFYWPLAFVIGEMAYMATQPDRWSLWPLALVAIVAGATPSLVGVAIARRFLKE